MSAPATLFEYTSADGRWIAYSEVLRITIETDTKTEMLRSLAEAIRARLDADSEEATSHL